MCRLFIHEIKRVFMDRMVQLSDIDILDKYLGDALGGDVFEKEQIDQFTATPLVFTPFIYEMKQGEF